MASRWLATRIDAEEWLDHGNGSPEAIAQSLSDLERINRWLGGAGGFAKHLYPRLRSCPTNPVRVLDLGAGGCTLPAIISRWAVRAAIPIRLVALDLRAAHLQWAQARLRQPDIALVQGDVFAPPFAAGSVDVVISSLFLHHFTAAELTELLPQWVCLARHSLVMTDLVRHPLPYWFMQASSALFARSPITRHDAAVSLRRAYRPQELRQIAAAAGFHRAQVFTHFPYRMTLVIDRVEDSG